MSKYLDSKLLEIALGIFLILISLLFLIKREWVVPPGKTNNILGGTLSGFAAGLLGTGGAIRGVTMAAFNLEKSLFIATSAAIDFGIDFTRTIVYFFNGYIAREILIYIPFLFAIGFIGTYAGKYLLKFISQENFRVISLVLILVIGVMSVGKVLYHAI